MVKKSLSGHITFSDTHSDRGGGHGCHYSTVTSLFLAAKVSPAQFRAPTVIGH